MASGVREGFSGSGFHTAKYSPVKGLRAILSGEQGAENCGHGCGSLQCSPSGERLM